MKLNIKSYQYVENGRLLATERRAERDTQFLPLSTRGNRRKLCWLREAL